MARLDDKLPHNVDGEVYVDRSCIDCDICRQLAPATFTRADQAEKSYVYRQPQSAEEMHRALMALVACPTSSIGTLQKVDLAQAVRAFPELVEENVYACGFAAESSFGASSYLIARPGANVLVDSPRAAKPLLRRLLQVGGVQTMFLTHRDDVADHEEFRRVFGCERVMHRDDVTKATEAVEMPLEGSDPVILDDELTAIPVPGHSRGSTALLYRDRYLFTGDHLWWSPERKRLHASRSVCWFSWKDQLGSLRKLLDFQFEWILPGHGRRFHAASPSAMRDAILEMLTLL